MPIFRKSVVAILLFLVMALPLATAAQGVPAIEDMEVALWPEYDRPEMLVIYRILWSSTMALPAEVTMRIPASVGEPNAVAERGEDGGLYNVAYDREVHGEWALISFIAAGPATQLEYYDPGIVKDGEARHYEYRWSGDYPVERFRVQVQQPARAEDLVIAPSLGGGTLGSDGLLYYGADIGTFVQDDSFVLSLDYRKDTEALTIELAEEIRVEPSVPITADTAGRVNLMDALPWMIGVVGILLVVGGVLLFWRGDHRKLQPSRPAASATRRRRRGASARAAPAGDQVVYCHQCGKRSEAGDLFCRACGTKLRVGES